MWPWRHNDDVINSKPIKKQSPEHYSSHAKFGVLWFLVQELDGEIPPNAKCVGQIVGVKQG